MKINTGIQYEHKVYGAISSVNSFNSAINVIGPAPTGGFNAYDTDMKVVLNDTPFDLEIKGTATAQMGGTSFQYDIVSKNFTSVKPIPKEDEILITESISEIKPNIDKFIEFIQQCEPVAYHSKNDGFPMSVTKNAWSIAQQSELMKPINAKISTNIDFVHSHYAAKGVNYIQIGGSGLFYLKENPLDLPVPQLDGNINVEVRLGRGGSKERLVEGETHKVAGAGIRIQGRLKFKGHSPYTLDCPESIVKLIEAIK